VGRVGRTGRSTRSPGWPKLSTRDPSNRRNGKDSVARQAQLAASVRASKKSKKDRQRKEAGLTTAGGAPAVSSPAAGAVAVGSCSGWLSIITEEGCPQISPLPELPISSCCLVWWRRGAVAIREGEVGGLLGVTPLLRSGQPNPSASSSSKLPFPCSARVLSQQHTDGRKREGGRRRLLSSRPCPKLIVSFSPTSLSIDFFQVGPPPPLINYQYLTFSLQPSQTRPTTGRRSSSFLPVNRNR
jgi:hypothetical protein